MTRTQYPPNESSGRDAAVLVRRYVNDEIAEMARRFDEGAGAQFEFVCECGDLSCTRHIRMTLARFEGSAPGSVIGH